MLATIGYEKSSLEDFVATLRGQGVEMLVDVRDRAQSRRKGFSKTALSLALEEAGIDYIHLKELGDPKEGRDAARAGDFDKFKKIFSAVLETEAAQSAILKILNLLNEQKSLCLMCYERDPSTCHRKVVADKLYQNGGVKAIHLGVREGEARRAEGRRVLHTRESAAA